MKVTSMIKPIEKVQFDNVLKKEMDIEDFLKLPAVPMQRFTAGRAKTTKVKKMLSGHVQSVHLDVALVELTQARSRFVDSASQRAQAVFQFHFQHRVIEYYLGTLDPGQPLFN